MAHARTMPQDTYIRAFVESLKEEFSDIRIADELDTIHFRMSDDPVMMSRNYDASVPVAVMRSLYRKLVKLQSCATLNRKRIETDKERVRRKAKLHGLKIIRQRRGW